MLAGKNNWVWWQRLTAVAAVALVLLLDVLTAGPSLHALVHRAERPVPAGRSRPDAAPVGDADHVCAVTLFAHGAEALQGFILVCLVRSPRNTTAARPRDRRASRRPRYWLQPSHGPPAD